MAFLHNKGENESVSGIVLAGGISRRLGRDKALENVGGQPLIGRVIERLSPVANPILVVVNSRERANELLLTPVVTAAIDIYPDSGSLGGIFTGLSSADTEWGVVVACDMPFLNGGLLDHMLSLREGYDAVVPLIDGRPEPTHAVYSRACLPAMESKLVARELKIDRFFDDVRVRFVTEQEMAPFDPGLLSFFNVNTQEDLDKTIEMVARDDDVVEARRGPSGDRV